MTGEDALERLADTWTALWSQSKSPSPMLELGWIRQWWALHRHEGSLLLIVALDQRRRPVGLAPLYIRRPVAFTPEGCLRTVCFLGTGERERDEVAGEYTSWLGPPEAMALVSRHVAAHLLAIKGEWDRVRLVRMQPEAGIHEELPGLVGQALAAHESVAQPTFRSPVLPIEHYLTALPSGNFRHRCRRALRAGQDEGVAFVRARGRDEHAAMFGAIRTLHQRRWRECGQPGAFASPVFSRFHESVVERCADDERLWLVGLRRGSEWLAVRYHLRAADHLYDYLSGVDTKTATALAPGLLLHLYTIEACGPAGIRVYDFGAGDYEFKRRLALETAQLYTVDLFARTARARLWLAARRLKRAAPRSRWFAREETPGGADEPRAEAFE